MRRWFALSPREFVVVTAIVVCPYFIGWWTMALVPVAVILMVRS